MTEETLAHVEDVRVVRHFPNVFSDDLPGLPSDREMEFTIDLIPGANPVIQVAIGNSNSVGGDNGSGGDCSAIGDNNDNDAGVDEGNDIRLVVAVVGGGNDYGCNGSDSSNGSGCGADGGGGDNKNNCKGIVVM
ncbi:nacrein-like protein C1 [Pyrus x bretschneideri]|uniref:nacrein-like protein C1 n=1 Tax=Pyrus x bretschneideri TaxID=225117 RepID=UPI002030D595|nr:nacrein-like protein C1 [Pyrus x bretschneideri]